LRIAKQMYLHGVTEGELATVCSRMMDSGVSQSETTRIQNYWRDIDRGVIETLDDIPDVVV